MIDTLKAKNNQKLLTFIYKNFQLVLKNLIKLTPFRCNPLNITQTPYRERYM